MKAPELERPAALDGPDARAPEADEARTVADSQRLELGEGRTSEESDWEFNAPTPPLRTETESEDALAASDATQGFQVPQRSGSRDETLDHWLDTQDPLANATPSLAANTAWETETLFESPESTPESSLPRVETRVQTDAETDLETDLEAPEPEMSSPPSRIFSPSVEPPTEELIPSVELSRPFVRAGNVLGWLCVALLVITALARGVAEPLWQAVFPSRGVGGEMGGLLEGEWIPDSSGHPVYRVTGRSSQPPGVAAGQTAVATLQLLDASGRRVGTPVIAREDSGSEGSWNFQAVLPEVPADAVFYRLEWTVPQESPRKSQDPMPPTLAASAFKRWGSRR
ncbi:hypothetical protein MK489_12855 [Myxococcota bacterium]|nr:hypothetical protein [Myxococcota bacterium]